MKVVKMGPRSDSPNQIRASTIQTKTEVLLRMAVRSRRATRAAGSSAAEEARQERDGHGGAEAEPDAGQARADVDPELAARPRCRPDRRAPGPGAGTGRARSARTRRSRRRVPRPAPAASAGGAVGPAATDRSGAPAGRGRRAGRSAVAIVCAPCPSVRRWPVPVGGRAGAAVAPARRAPRGARRPGPAGRRRVRRRSQVRSTRAGRAVSSATREPTVRASSMPWVTKTIVLPVARQILTRVACRSRRVSGSRALNGSSISRISGSMASARAIAAALLHPAREVSGEVPLEAVQTDQGQVVGGARPRRRRSGPAASGRG